jgi:hypothetical protein
MGQLRTQAIMISIFAPVALSDHLFKIIDYYHEMFVQFTRALGHIDEQLRVAAANPKQEIVVDVADLRTAQSIISILSAMKKPPFYTALSHN